MTLDVVRVQLELASGMTLQQNSDIALRLGRTMLCKAA
jgi:hypothetical protein